ncbi:MAG: efflux RND transporter periplasmic adaptor subunit [Planctomycetota bacterium]|nr:MAG: efflux RND transporter periplasmic adaptor subunit [Planctomycetota bacterium]
MGGFLWQGRGVAADRIVPGPQPSIGHCTFPHPPLANLPPRRQLTIGRSARVSPLPTSVHGMSPAAARSGSPASPTAAADLAEDCLAVSRGFTLPDRPNVDRSATMYSQRFEHGRSSSRSSRPILVGPASTIAWIAVSLLGSATPAADTPSTEPASGPDNSRRLIVLQREPLRIVHADRFDVHPQLEPARHTVLRAEVPGRVVAVAAQPGQQLSAQETILRIDSPAYVLKQRIARQRLAVSQAELEQANASRDEAQRQLAAAKVELAKLELQEAESLAQRATVVAPYAATVIKVLVEEGDFVQPGAPVAEVADLSRLVVNLPVRFAETKPGRTVKLQIDTEEVSGVVQAVVPLDERYAALHRLQIQLASAIVQIDNTQGRLMPGWVVAVPFLPRTPVVLVPLQAVSSDAKGRRQVFVLRDDVIRRIPVRLLGQLGTESVYVTGPFASDDELITASSAELVDGTVVRRATADDAAGLRSDTAASRVVTPPTEKNASKSKKPGF